MATMESLVTGVCKMVAEHVIAALVTVGVIVCLAAVYYAFQHGVIDDKSEEIIEVPLGN